MKKRLFKSRKSVVRALILTAAFVLAVLCTAALYGRWAGLLQSQRAAERFRGESRQPFAQATAMYPAGEGTDRQGIYEFQKSLNAKLLEASLEAPENGSLYMDAWSAEGRVTVTGNRDTTEASVLAVGGDWFRFHPMEFKFGSYFSGDDLRKDYVVLDEDLAWTIFGGLDVAGLDVTIGGKPFLVAGVVKREDDFATKKAYSGGAGLFMSWDALAELQEGLKITVYEVCCAEPVSGFTLSAVKEGFPNCDTVQNSGRFSVEKIFGIIRNLGARSMRQSAVIYPYWENAARVVEDRLAVVLAAAVLLAVFPAAVVVLMLWALGQRLAELVKGLVRKLADRIERQRYKRYLKKKEARAGGGGRVPERKESLQR